MARPFPPPSPPPSPPPPLPPSLSPSLPLFLPSPPLVLYCSSPRKSNALTHALIHSKTWHSHFSFASLPPTLPPSPLPYRSIKVLRCLQGVRGPSSLSSSSRRPLIYQIEYPAPIASTGSMSFPSPPDSSSAASCSKNGLCPSSSHTSMPFAFIRAKWSWRASPCSSRPPSLDC